MPIGGWVGISGSVALCVAVACAGSDSESADAAYDAAPADAAAPLRDTGGAGRDSSATGGTPGMDSASGTTSASGAAGVAGVAGAAPSDANADASQACSSLPFVYSSALAGNWDCVSPSCIAGPPPAGDPACRATDEPGVFVYRSLECWQSFHPGSDWGKTVDFSREIVASTCADGTCGDALLIEGAEICGTEATVRLVVRLPCEKCGSDCNLHLISVVLPASIERVRYLISSDEEPSLPADGAFCRSDFPARCAPPAVPQAPDSCWRACDADSDCVLVQSDCCGCYEGGRRVAVRGDIAAYWTSGSCSGGCDDVVVCGDCNAGYGSARAACVAGACSVVCGTVQDGGADAGPADCESLERDYLALVTEAKRCAPQSSSCTALVGSTLECMCGTLVNSAATDALDAMQALTQRYYALDCQWTTACDCGIDPTSASCDTTDGGGVCVDRFD